MNTYTKLLLRVIVFISLIYGLSTTVTAQTKKLLSVQDYTSIAKIISKAEGTDLTFTRPYSPGGSMTIFAGTFNGTLNSASKKFYCIDLSQPLAYSPDEYWDEGSTPSQITYILNNYYPLKTSYTGKLSDNNKEAAAVQIAIWYFSDNVNANTVTDATIRTRALAIIADATLNAGNTNPLATLQVIPTNQTVPAGTPASFYVQAISLSNTPVSGVTIQLTTTLGTLSTTSVITGSDGKTPTITLNSSSNGTASVKAKATVEIPQGTKYVHKTNPNNHQKLVLATPATDVKEVFTNIEFTCKNKIGSYVYRDINANGTKDTGEPGIAGAVVELVQGSTVIATATTDVNGFYSFTNLPNGTYIVRLHASNFAFGGVFFNTDAVKWQTKNSTYVNTTLNCNDNLSINFGYYKICIGVTKTADKTTYSPGDIVTYTITVENCGDLALASGVDVYDNLLWGTTAHHINLINPGQTYTFPVTDTKYTVKPSDCDKSLINTVRAEGHPADGSATVFAETSVTVTILCNASIGDRVWLDTNGNGLQDSGEPGMGGVTVNLYDCSNVYQATTTTDGNGNYLFSNLPTGSYYVKFVLPAGFTFTTKDVGTNDAIDSDADVTTGKTICTTLSPNESDMTWDAGLKECKNKIGDFVWHDANANGIQDDGTSSGIGGVVVELLNSSGGLITSTTTLSNGYYEFANLSNGTYSVRIAASNFTTIGNQLYSNNANEKWFMTFKDKITDDTKDSDGDIATKTATVTLSCADNMTIDFGFFKVCVGLQKTGPASVNVGDKITYSFTVTNCGDILLAGGVRVYDALLKPDGDHEIQYLTLTPGQSATFTYDYTTTLNNCGNLINNAWVIGFPSLSGYTFNTTVRADDSHTVNVICNASIGDRVWIDTNGNGLQDNGEAGKSGVTVKLYDCSDNLKGTTTTNTSGNYLFNNLIPGSYYVKFDLPTGFTFTTKDVGTNDAIDSNADPTTGKTICTTLSAGENDMTWDAGLIGCKNTVGSYVYRDKNANGAKDSGEFGIANVVVELVQSSTVIATATTDANGFYSFPNLSNGTYTVRLHASNFTSGGVFFNTATVKWYTKNSTSISTTLNCNDNLSINFGYYKTCVSITKTANKQIVKPGDIITYTLTVQNCGDIQLASGVDIYDTMFPIVGKPNPLNVTLNSGNYYVVTYSYTVTANDCGTNNCGTIVNKARAVGHPLGISEDVESSVEVTVIVDCAQCLNKIGDFIWHDRNANGIQETGEPGISGVLVELLIGGSPYKTSTTDGTGKYKFENIPNGTYDVRIATSNYAYGGVLYSTLQTKWYSSPKNQGSDDTKDSDANLGEPVTVTVSCNNDLAIDFGFYKTCVSITKTADKQTAKPGEFINYTLTIDNCGDIALASGLDIYDEMFLKVGLPNPYYITLVSNNFQVINYSYRVNDDDCGGILINTARAVGHPANGSADVIDESTWSVAITCDMKSDLSIVKTVDNSNPGCGDIITYTITVKNNGPFKALGVEVTDLLPTGLDYLSNTPSQGTFNSSNGRWLVGALNNGASATLAIRVKVNCVKINSATNILGQAKNYNLFVIEDLNQPSSDTQGKMAVGRDAYLANYSVGDALPSNSGDVLVVGRNLQFTSGRVYNGNAVYGNSTNLPTGPVTVDGSLRKDSPIDFVSAKAYLENLSTMLSGYTVNGTTTFQWSGLTLTGTDPYLNVFKVSGANLSAATSVTINAPNGSVVLVNIDGAYVTWTGGHVVNGTSIGNVLYNFYETTNLQIRAIDVRGSVLAPFAALYFPSGLISGQVICKSMVGAGQFNLSPFVGNIPCDKEITNTACITGVTTTDPNLYNNSASVKIIVSNNGSGSGTGSGNTGGWQFTGGFAVGEIIYTMTCINNDIYAGTSSGKIYKSTNRGQTWTRINNSMNVSFIWSLINYNGTLYAATDQGIFFYYNGTWILAGLSSIDVHSLVAKNGIIYAGTWGSGVFKSTGSSWSPINTGLSSSLTIQSLTIGNSGDVFAGTVGGGLFKLTNGVGSWNAVSGGNNLVWSTGSTASAVFAGTYGEGLYRSIDGGYSFSKLTSLDVPYVYSIVNDGTGKVYVSSLTSGVFVSSDNGYTWTSLGMGGVGVSSITVNASTGQVYAGTKGGQVYSISSNNNATDVNDNLVTPTEYKLAQNYPNPFNPSTTIEFAVPDAGMYSLKVYNTLGQEVANLVENELASGLHKVNFDASKLASGMYIYKLSGNNVNVSKKMILMK